MTLHANIYSFEGKLLEAENRLNEVLTLNPDYPLALYFLGVVYHEKGDDERAIHMYKTALKHFSEDKKEDIADVYQNLGCSLWEAGAREEALEAWETCLKYNPEQKYAQENIKNFTNEYGMDTSLIAQCGMNCGICMAYLRDKNKCPGCRGDDFHKAVTVIKCKIKNCIIYQTSEAKFCFECEQFPCDNLKHLDKRYRTKYNMSMVENLENIKNFGIRTFLGTEKKKWTCSECGGTICVHKGYCYSCGKKKQP
jgi:tetratricopeptide (TPR) repeat protein